jgi:hypothetical protein
MDTIDMDERNRLRICGPDSPGSIQKRGISSPADRLPTSEREFTPWN